MNKKDLLPIIVLALMIPLWMVIDQKFIAPKFPAPAPVPAEQPADSAPVAGNIESASLSEAVQNITEEAKTTLPEAVPAEEKLAVLENDKVRLELTSLGGGIKSATLLDYPEKNEEGSNPVVLDFSGFAALAYDGILGVGPTEALAMQALENGSSVTFSKTLENGTVFQRTITLSDGYLLTINDRFANPTDAAWLLSGHRILTGRMKNPADMESMKGMTILGVDSFAPASGINYWGRKLNKLYKLADKPFSLDAVPEDMQGKVVDWVSAKNKFFTQILRTEQPVATMAVLSNRDTAEKGVIPVDVAAALAFKPLTIAAGSQHEINYSYYVGPKKYSILKDAGHSMEKVMEFETIGAWSFMNWLMEASRKFLLYTMNAFKGVIPGGYGIAIILLTLLIRILFWPLTHKSTESMKRMQEIQPEVKALQEKYAKSNPQKLQQETMKLYKEKKVNPMGGCLPMFVQIPVFFALFTVLRNAIELRFADFLWIADLSASENLFAGQVPFVGSLNILPLLMSASMIWQQKLTPTAAATPEQQQQQKMMMFMMPIMMLFFFYKMPSGLVLYWTTSNLLMIAQTGIRNFRKKKAEA
jgi:YidC/Oxa1 family membrane protein insertase